MYWGTAPPRGMAAVEPLTATQHEAGTGHGRICGLGRVGGSTRRHRCGAGLTGAHGQPQAEPVQVWQERAGRSLGEGHWVALAPGRYHHPALAAGGSQVGPGPPWRAAHAGHWPGSSAHGSAALPDLGKMRTWASATPWGSCTHGTSHPSLVQKEPASPQPTFCPRPEDLWYVSFHLPGRMCGGSGCWQLMTVVWRRLFPMVCQTLLPSGFPPAGSSHASARGK